MSTTNLLDSPDSPPPIVDPTDSTPIHTAETLQEELQADPIIEASEVPEITPLDFDGAPPQEAPQDSEVSQTSQDTTELSETPQGVAHESTGGLVYVGNGSFVPNVPARDLTHAELVELARASTLTEVYTWLVSTGLYQAPQSTPESE